MLIKKSLFLFYLNLFYFAIGISQEFPIGWARVAARIRKKALNSLASSISSISFSLN